MEIHLPRSNAEKKLNRTLALLSAEFPQLAHQMSEIAKSKHGITLELKPLKTRRSRPQENYYRQWCGKFASYCGLTPDEMHEEMLCQCYGSEIRETKFGEKRRPRKRSNDATRGDFSDLIETLCRIAAEMGFDIPPPVIDSEC